MITFFTDCCSLFTSIFNALFGNSFFAFILSFVLIYFGFGLFYLIYKGTRKL